MNPDDVVAGTALLGAAVCGVFAIIAPWFALWFGRTAAAAVAGVLTVGATIFQVVSARYMHVGPNVNIRPDLLIYPLLLADWLIFFGLVVAAVSRTLSEDSALVDNGSNNT